MIRAERLSNRYRRGPLVLAGADLAVEPGGTGRPRLRERIGQVHAAVDRRGLFDADRGPGVGASRVVGYLPDRRGCDRGERRGGSSRLSIRNLRATETVGGSS